MRERSRSCALSLFALLLLITSVARADQKWFTVGKVCGTLKLDGRSRKSVKYSVLVAAGKDLPCCEGTRKVADGETGADGSFGVSSLGTGQYFLVTVVQKQNYIFPIWIDRINENVCSPRFDQIFEMDSKSGNVEVTAKVVTSKARETPDSN
jgi:hypothetical protein